MSRHPHGAVLTWLRFWTAAFVLVVLACSTTASFSDSAPALSMHMARSITGQGVHREVVTELSFQPPPTQAYETHHCGLLLFQYFPATTYVDTYELQELARSSGAPQTCILGFVDIERPSWDSSSIPFAVALGTEFSFTVASPSVLLTLPFHLRYQPISEDATHRPAIIVSPEVYATCTSKTVTTTMTENSTTTLTWVTAVPPHVAHGHRASTMAGVFLELQNKFRNWTNVFETEDRMVTREPEFRDWLLREFVPVALSGDEVPLRAYMPVGLKQHRHAVVILTILVTTIAACAICAAVFHYGMSSSNGWLSPGVLSPPGGAPLAATDLHNR
eukprot:gnl/Spiro4/8808_TR4632_c0_g3_i1.p1 gnl/Spiro4/8808_TR4632_c0_g3~~gnl/Spiro4/8808_TR4632_c0_g3_i1.p1  ORF type:complete len:332 (+),score=51.16 gnl/Spiro4/8808_TR4632_c0_g3_i1:99-1094(+)